MKKTKENTPAANRRRIAMLQRGEVKGKLFRTPLEKQAPGDGRFVRKDGER
jgi:hypothetical protein